MSSLGIYFGPKTVSVVETKGKRIISSFQIPASAYLNTNPEDKVPEEVKLVAYFKDELRKNRVESKEAVIALSSTDLIIRTFEIPFLPANELASVVNFEAKKYIPFKMDELICSYQAQVDKTSHKYFILFVGIKKETLDKYLSILRQLNLKISSIEYSAFSILRLVSLSGYKESGVAGILNIDSLQEDDADFTVIENNFPLFSRDIKIIGGAQDASGSAGEAAIISDKLRTEIRVSLDYYHRKFPLKKIKEILLIGSQQTQPDVEAIMQELGLPLKIVDPSKITGKTGPYNLGFLKAYSSALVGELKSAVKIDLLMARERSRQLKELARRPKDLAGLMASGFKLDARAVILSVFICIMAFIFGSLQKVPLVKELNLIISSRPAVSSVNPTASFEELQLTESEFQNKLSEMDTLIKKQLYLTPQLSDIATLVPEGMWLEGFTFRNSDKKAEFTLEGLVYLGNSSEELEKINNFLLALKKNSLFSKTFSQINIVSLDNKAVENKKASHFIISGGQKE